ncbi:MAG: sodium:solute symporter [Planctomycetaceae bacterium]|nr:sodium:solute symporter [Planctomycetaceae bacterium]
MKLEAFDLAIIVLYNVIVLAMGIGFFRRTKTSEQFMAAGRDMPGWAVGLSIFGSYVSSISFLANPGKAYGPSNWNAALFAFIMPPAAYIAVRWFVPFYRSTGEVSAYTHLEHRFGAWARTYAVICFLLTQITRLGMILYLLSLAMSPLFGADEASKTQILTTTTIILGVVVVIYPFLGGTEAVIWTGVLQALILIAGAVSCAAVLLFGMPEGPGQIFRIAAEHDKFSFGSFDWSFAASTVWVVVAYGVIEHLKNFGVDQAYVQRYITAKSDAAAKRSIWIGTVLFMPISLTFFFIGTALFAFYTAQPQLLPAGEFKPDDVFPHFIANELPVGITGLVIAAICAAAMDSNLNSCATLLLEDIHLRYIHPKASERESIWFLRTSTVVLGLTSIFTGIMFQQFKSALDAWWLLAGIFGGGVLGLFLLGLISRRAGNLSGLIGVICGVLTIMWMTLSLKLGDLVAWMRASDRIPDALATITEKAGGVLIDSATGKPYLHELLIPVVGTAVILVVGLLVSLVERPATKPV